MPAELSAPIDAATVERVLLQGDLGQLTPAQKIAYYRSVCDSLGLNPLTQPFDYITLEGKERFYAKREATEQLRKIHNVSLTITARETQGGVYIVSARATLPNGRTDESTGVVAIAGRQGDVLANLYMKAETKAKRRVTLSVCGLGILDESEIDSLPVSLPSPRDPVAADPLFDEPPMESYATVQATPPEPVADYPPPRPKGAVTIVRVDSSPTKNPSVRQYFITTSTGQRVKTIKEEHVTLAKRAIETGALMRIKSKTTQWGDELVSITTADDDSIPF